MENGWTPRDIPPAQPGRYTVTVEMAYWHSLDRKVAYTRKVIPSFYGKPWGRFRGGSWWQVERGDGATRVISWREELQPDESTQKAA